MGALIHVTAWEKASPLRRVIVAFGRVAVFFALLFALAFIAYANRYPLAARIWHWTHGYSASVDGYVIPVAERWLVVNHDSAFSIVNTAPSRPLRDGKVHTAAVISLLSSKESPNFDLNFWLSLKRQRLVREGVTEVEEKTASFGDESLTCIGGSELSAIVPSIQTDAIVVDCRSRRGLEVMLVGGPSDLQPFYIFLSQIRRKR